ncbi:high affinity sulphate transporter 1 [Ruminococcaceae bacterium YRB3002]|nr:high affinity sulphate transporter 1 [Ruminococcaceae bacterium YRB3002]
MNHSRGIFPDGYKAGYVPRDIFAGLIVALVSIPISMGYAQIAGLPMIYGLYGSLFPILVFGLLTTSRDFVFGVDAAPAALTGGLIASLGIASGSDDAVRTVPIITLCVSLWLLAFFVLKAGRAVKYISTPVMGGFITGICIEIILIQVPKLMGGTAGTGEVFELLAHIWEQRTSYNLMSAVLGAATVAVILIVRKLAPKIPMSVIMMAAGALLTVFTGITDYGVKLLPEVPSGLPLPTFYTVDPDILPDIFIGSMTIALVIMSETLLASRQNAINDGYDLDSRREVLAYTGANLVSGIFGCCPVNASVSRTSIVRQFGGRSQLMSIAASVFMALILLFGTGFIAYLPVPVLTGIVVAALLTACEFHLAGRLLKTSPKDFLIFIAAMAGVLIFGTVYGVLIGVILSFIAVIIKAVTPPRSYMGIITGRDGFYSLKRNKNAVPVEGALIYRFGGNIFFANIDTFVSDIEAGIKDDTKIVIVYGSGIGSIDITAADRIKALRDKLEDRGIRFFMTEHDGVVNDELIKFGAGDLVHKGNVRLTVDTAMRAAGIHEPYTPESVDREETVADNPGKRLSESLLMAGHNAEIEWAYGKNAEKVKMQLVLGFIAELTRGGEISTTEDIVSLERRSAWGRLSYTDEDEILMRIEDLITEHPDSDLLKGIDVQRLSVLIEQRRAIISERLNGQPRENNV